MLSRLIIALLFFASNAYAQIEDGLIPIQTEDASPIGTNHFEWACVANFSLSDAKNFGRIKFIETDKQGNIFVVDNNGYLYALSGDDFSEKWKTYLGNEHLLNFKVSPNGKTLAICYNYIKCATKKLEVRNATNGRILLKIKRIPECYDASYFVDVVDNTTLYPFDIAYSPDGNKLAVWFKNHGFDDQQCKANLEEQFIIMSPKNGDVYAERKHIPADFEFDKCDGDYTFVFSNNGESIYIGNCRGEIAQYHAQNLDLIKVSSFGDRINEHLTENLGDKGSKKGKFSFNELVVQKDGDLITSVGKQGRIFKIKSDLSSLNYITQNQGTIDGHFSFSPDWSLAMFNADQINLWDLKSKQPVLYAKNQHATSANTVRFHPTKKALIVGTKRNIKILAACPTTRIEVGGTFTPTGHFLNAETSFAVRGKGKIYWSFDDKVIYHKYAKEDEITTETLGYSSLFNTQQNIPHSSELRIKTDHPGVYTIFGGTNQRLNNAETLQSLPNWE